MKQPSLEVFATCMLACHLQLDAIHTFGKSDPHSSQILHAVRPITHVQTNLIFWVRVSGTQEPISTCLEDLLFYHMLFQALL